MTQEILKQRICVLTAIEALAGDNHSDPGGYEGSAAYEILKGYCYFSSFGLCTNLNESYQTGVLQIYSGLFDETLGHHVAVGNVREARIEDRSKKSKMWHEYHLTERGEELLDWSLGKSYPAADISNSHAVIAELDEAIRATMDTALQKGHGSAPMDGRMWYFAVRAHMLRDKLGDYSAAALNECFGPSPSESAAHEWRIDVAACFLQNLSEIWSRC